MYEINLLEAFARYKVKSGRRTRSAMTPDGDLVISCWYGGFKKAQAEILRYEEDLGGQTNETTKALRTHLAQALSNEWEVRVIVAVEIAGIADGTPDCPVVTAARTAYYARKDLLGRVCSFDGERFIVEFRRAEVPVQGVLPRGKKSQRMAASQRQ